MRFSLFALVCLLGLLGLSFAQVNYPLVEYSFPASGSTYSVPLVGTIKITNTGNGNQISVSGGEIGDVQFSVDANTRLIYDTADDSVIGIAYIIPSTYRLSNTLSFLQNGPFDLSFEGTKMYVSYKKFRDPSLEGVALDFGLGFVASVTLRGGIMDSVKKLMPILPDRLAAAATISDKLQVSAIIPLPGWELKVGPALIKFSALEFYAYVDTKLALTSVGGAFLKAIGKGGSSSSSGTGSGSTTGPSLPSMGVGIKAHGQFKPSSKDNTLYIMGNFEVTDTKAIGKFSISGVWENIGGISGLSIGNVGFELGVFYTCPSPAGPVPCITHLAASGQIEIATIKVTVAFRWVVDELEFGFLFRIDRIDLYDIVGFFNRLGLPKIPQVVPNFRLEQLEFKYAPKKMVIGEISYPGGIGFSAIFVVENGGSTLFRLTLICKVDILNLGPLYIPTAIHAEASMSAITLGPLKISGLGPDGKWGTSDDGPVVNLEISASTQKFVLSGLVELFSFRAAVDVIISIREISIFTELKLGDLFYFSVAGAFSAKDKDITASFTLKNNIQDKVISLLSQGYASLKEDFSEGCDDAEDDLKEAMDKVNSLQSQIDKLVKELNAKKKDALDKLESAQDKVDGLSKDIKDAKKKLKDCSSWNLVCKSKYAGKIAAYEVAKKAADIALAAAKKVVDSFPLASADPRVVSLRAAKATADAALRLAQAAVDKGCDIINKILDVSKKILTKGLQLFYIRSASFSGSLQNLIKTGTVANLRIEVVFCSKAMTFNLEFNINKPSQMFKSMAKTLKDNVDFGKCFN